MNIRAPAFLVVLLALGLAIAFTSAFAQPPAFADRSMIYAAQSRFATEMHEAAVAFEQALAACRLSPADERIACERDAKERHRNAVGLARVRLANEHSTRG